MQQNHPWIILFDIDGTLLTVDRMFNRQLLRKLLDELEINYPDMEKDAFSGRTDHDIFRSFMIHHSDDPKLYQNFKSVYLERIANELDAEKVTRHDYVDEAISYFSGDDFVRGLLTGNYPSAAAIKLKAANIDYEFSIGAFGEDIRDRNQLPFLAIDQAEELLGYKPDPTRFVIIGDTPRDIICANGAGMKCVAVTTGKFSKEELAQHQPDLIIPNLSNPEEWFQNLVKKHSTREE